MTSPKPGKPVPPVIRYAPLGELKVYNVHEYELDELARGSPAALLLNFALALLPISITLAVTLATTTIQSVYYYAALVSVCAVTLISGLVLLGLWARQHATSKKIVETIKNRMPLPDAIQDSSGQ